MEAKAQGTSLNKTIKRLLEEALGIKLKSDKLYEQDFIDIFGTWSPNDLKQFEKSTGDLRQLDDRDWK